MLSAILNISLIMAASLAVFWATSQVFKSVSDVETASRILSGLCNILLLGMVIAGIPSILNSVYFSKDLRVLRAMPVRGWTIFSYKLCSVLLDRVFFVACLAAMLAAYAAVFEQPVLLYLLIPVISLVAVVIPSGLGMFIVTLLTRITSVGRFKTPALIGGASFLLLALVAIRYALLGPSQQNALVSPSYLQSPDKISLFSIPPGSWISGSLFGLSSLRVDLLLGDFAPLLLLSLGTVILAVWTSSWAYASGDFQSMEAINGSSQSTDWLRTIVRWLPQDVGAVALKDALSLFRNPQRLIPCVVISATGIFNALSSGQHDAAAPGSWFLDYFLGSWWVCFMFSWLFLPKSVGIEGRSYWVMAVAPLSPGRIIVGKWVSILPVGMLSILLSCVGIALISGFRSAQLIGGFAAGVTVFAATALCSIGFAAVFSNFHWENPNSASSLWATILSIASAFGVLLLSLVAVGTEVVLQRYVPDLVAIGCAVSVWLAAMFGPGAVLLIAGARRLEKLEW